MKYTIVIVVFFSVASAHDHNGVHGGSGSGEHGAHVCFIAPAGTTNCTGATGSNCTDNAALAVSSTHFPFRVDQCDQMGNEFFQYLAIYNNKLLNNSTYILPK